MESTQQHLDRTEQPAASGATPFLEVGSVSSRDPIGVLFIIDQLCARGGAENVLLRMIERLPRERYSPRVVSFKIDEELGIAESITCPLHVFPLRRTYDWGALQVALRIRRLIKSHNIQIAHTFHETADLWGGLVAKASGCPILISSRRDMGFLRKGKHWPAYRWLARCFDEVQTVSEEVRKFCIEKDKLDPERVATIHNGVDLREPPAVDKRFSRMRFGLDVPGPLVVSVGHVRKIKGFDVFLRAAELVRHARPDAVFAIAGDDHEPAHTEELRRKVDELGMTGNFVFLGPIYDVGALLRASDVFCLLSRSEGLSNALLDAMACRLPCVVTRVGGNPEVVVEGLTGYIVESEDAEAAGGAVLSLLDNPVRARLMGLEGRRVVEEGFTTEVMMRRIVGSYEQLLSSCGKAS